MAINSKKSGTAGVNKKKRAGWKSCPFLNPIPYEKPTQTSVKKFERFLKKAPKI